MASSVDQSRSQAPWSFRSSSLSCHQNQSSSNLTVYFAQHNAMMNPCKSSIVVASPSTSLNWFPPPFTVSTQTSVVLPFPTPDSKRSTRLSRYHRISLDWQPTLFELPVLFVPTQVINNDQQHLSPHHQLTKTSSLVTERHDETSTECIAITAKGRRDHEFKRSNFWPESQQRKNHPEFMIEKRREGRGVWCFATEE